MPEGIKRVFLTPLDTVDTKDLEGVGTLRFAGNKLYKYVSLTNTTATTSGAAGDAVLYKAVTGGISQAVVIDDDDADTVPNGAGILMATIAGVQNTTYYCWIQIKGPATLAQAIAGSPDDGQPLQASGSDKTLTLAVDVDSGGDSIKVVAIACDESEKLVILDYPW